MSAAAMASQISYCSYQYKKNNLHVQTRSWFSLFGTPSKPDSAPLTETKLRSFNDRIILYQYATCPFCNKVKVYLDYYGIPYEKVEVRPVPKSQLSWFKGKKKKVPTVRVFQDDTKQELVIHS